MLVVKTLFWGSLGALAWTHAAIRSRPGRWPASASGASRRIRRWEPSVSVIVAAHNEDAVIERRLENLLALDYPPDRLEIVVASDASTDRTNELVEAVAAREPRVRLLDCPRGGKVAAQDRAVREATAEVVAFSDANATWAPDALAPARREPRRPRRRVRLRPAPARGRRRARIAKGLYWRYEVWLREQESRLGSTTGGYGSIYALKRADYVEVDPRWGHDLALPYRMVQKGRRAVYEPAAHAFEKPTPTNETEYARKVRMFEHCWEITLRGSMLRRLPPGYLVAMLSHRVLRYGSGVLHVALLATSVALLGEGWPYVARADRPACTSRRVRGPRPDRAVLRLRHVGDGAGALELPPPRRPRSLGSRGDAVNRAADIAVAGLGLALTSPLLAAAALAIKLEDRGPVLYRQTRVGKDGADFDVLKLRSMVVDAERQGAGFAVDRGDARITRVGRILRRTSIDELPQLWNVVRGDMSVIGPRPTLRYQVDRYDDAAAQAPRRAPGAHRLGAGQRPCEPALGGPDRARRLVRRASLAAGRPEDPAAHPARTVRRDVQGRERAAGEPED